MDFNIWDNITYKDNLIKVEVYYEEFNFEDISQSPAYEVRLTSSVSLLHCYEDCNANRDFHVYDEL